MSALPLRQHDITALARNYDEAVAAPERWTADHVLVRLVEAQATIERTTTRPRPRTGRSMPEPVVEFADLATLSHGEVLERWMCDVEASGAHRATKAQMSRAHEAMGWLARYLREHPQHADALALWLRCTVLDRSIKDALKARREAADALIANGEVAARIAQARAQGVEPWRKSVLEETARDRAALRETARKVSARANEHIAEREAEYLAKIDRWRGSKAPRVQRRRETAMAKTEAAVARIKRSARIIAKREALAIGAVAPKAPLLGRKRRDVMPGRVTSEWMANEYRKQAAAMIAEGLTRDGAEVR